MSSQTTLKAKLLLAMAMADGRFDPRELELLADRAMSWGISAEEFERIVNEPEISDEETLGLPEEEDERAVLFSELILMAFADGELDESELTVLIKLGDFLGFNENTVRTICRREADTFDVRIPEDL